MAAEATNRQPWHYYCGFPQIETRQLSVQKVEFGCLRGSGVASSINDRDIVALLEREHWIPVGDRPAPPENFNFGGISGGIMITVVEGRLRSWRLAGVIYEGPSTSADPNEAIPGFEIIRTRRADFIKPNGTLDTPFVVFSRRDQQATIRTPVTPMPVLTLLA